MKRILIPFLFAALTASAERENLWPEGKMPDAQPHQVAKMTNEKGDNAAPYIDWLPAPEKPNGCCMILISGGAYKNCCDVGLVDMWGKKFTAAGFQCVNLVYRTPRPKGLPFYQSAWEDGQRAVRLVRSQAVKRGFHADRIGTISMSAGSHLATLLATSALTPAYEKVDKIDDIPCHLNWAITGAIGYALDDGLGVANARGGEGAKLDPVFQFDKKTAPMCMFHGSADPYSPLASTQVYRELRKRRIPAELHLFADRGDKACAYDNWFDRAMEFLRQLGWFLGPLPHEESLIARYPADFHDPAKYARENLWPGGKTPDFQNFQCVPYLEWYIPSNLTTRAIQIVYSGGAYQFNDVGGFEVAPARRFLNEKGMAVVTMKYRTPRPKGLAKHVTAWQDLQRCIRLVRSEAASKGLDPDRIGIMGSSAGGHLTLLGVTSSQTPAYEPVDDIDKVPCNVQWGVAILAHRRRRPGERDGRQRRLRGARPRVRVRFRHVPDALHPRRLGRLGRDELREGVGEAARDGRRGRPAHALPPRALLPGQGRAGHGQLHLARPHLGVHEPQGVQQVALRAALRGAANVPRLLFHALFDDLILQNIVDENKTTATEFKI